MFAEQLLQKYVYVAASMGRRFNLRVDVFIKTLVIPEHATRMILYEYLDIN